MGKEKRPGIPVWTLGVPDLAMYTPHQVTALKEITAARQELAKGVRKMRKKAKGRLTPARMEAILRKDQDLDTDMRDAKKAYDRAICQAIRAGLDTCPYVITPCGQTQAPSHYASACAVCLRNRTLCELSRLGVIGHPRVREWIGHMRALGRGLRHDTRPLRSLRDCRRDLDRDMRKLPISQYKMALAEEVSRLLHTEVHAIKNGTQKRVHWKELFGNTEPLRTRLVDEARQKGEEEKAPHLESPWALQKFAEAHHLPKLMCMEPELQQRQPEIKELTARQATLQETLECLHPVLTTRYPLRIPRRWVHHIIMELMQTPSVDLTATYMEAFVNQLAHALPWVKHLSDDEHADLLADLAQACAQTRQTGQADVLLEVLEDWEAKLDELRQNLSEVGALCVEEYQGGQV
jgi:hypothetical protein